MVNKIIKEARVHKGQVVNKLWNRNIIGFIALVKVINIWKMDLKLIVVLKDFPRIAKQNDVLVSKTVYKTFDSKNTCSCAIVHAIMFGIVQIL